jgi:hypothetical protein
MDSRRLKAQLYKVADRAIDSKPVGESIRNTLIVVQKNAD